MLWDASAVKAYAIAGSDGQLGTVNDLLFEDSDWKIRWLVVDTGYWLHGRKVLIPVSALGHPDPAKREFAVKLTRLQIRQSPDAERIFRYRARQSGGYTTTMAGIPIGRPAISGAVLLQRPLSATLSQRVGAS